MMGLMIRLVVVVCVMGCVCSRWDDGILTQKSDYMPLGEIKPSNPSRSLPTYAIYLDLPAHERYTQLIEDKKNLLDSFIDYLYGIDNFRYSMWIARAVFLLLPDSIIRNSLGAEFYDECQGIAHHSERQLYEVIVYNYMYEIGAVNDFCTSIALTQTHTDSSLEIGQKQNLNLLARNLDYGFQKFLSDNTVRLDFYDNATSGKPAFTMLTHAGFVGSHTVLKYENEGGLQFGISLNQRESGSYRETVQRVLFEQCESVFQLINRILKSKISTTEQLINIVSESNSCSNFYSIIQTKTGDNLLIQKNYGIGVHQVYLKNSTNRQAGENPSYILQTNTDLDQPDPDGRRDQAVSKINAIIQQQGQIKQNDIRQVLLSYPNFNELTIMTAIMDVEKGSIDAVVWLNQQNSENLTFYK